MVFDLRLPLSEAAMHASLSRTVGSKSNARPAEARSTRCTRDIISSAIPSYLRLFAFSSGACYTYNICKQFSEDFRIV